MLTLESSTCKVLHSGSVALYSQMLGSGNEVFNAAVLRRFSSLSERKLHPIYDLQDVPGGMDHQRSYCKVNIENHNYRGA